MKILSIGDIHGRDTWQHFTHGSQYDFGLWKISIEAGADASSDFWKEMPYYNFDKIIFVGDYTDGFKVSNETILKNLDDIIFFKKCMPDKVVLLLGNHDIQYIIPNQICSGFRGEMELTLKDLFRSNKELFKIAHFEETTEKWLWSHAGVSQDWLDEVDEYLHKPDRFHHFNVEVSQKEVDEIVNWLFEANIYLLYTVDSSSMGFDKNAGPLWVRSYLRDKPLAAYNQIVGHTPCADLWKHEWDYKDEKRVIHYIDCLENYKALEIEI